MKSCTGTVATGAKINTATVGPKTFAVTATDVAGNTTTVTNAYTVVYAVTLLPVKGPATQGSAVPVTWELKDALGASVTSLSSLLTMESVFNGPMRTVQPERVVSGMSRRTSSTGIRPRRQPLRRLRGRAAIPC
jgi:hypothetical protein